jgi:hypothetical protein
MKIFRNIPIMIASGLIIVAGIVFYLTLVGVQQLVPVMTATSEIPAYSTIKQGQLGTIQLPKKAVDEQPWLLTEDEYQHDYVDAKRPLVTTARIFKGEAIDTNRVARVPQRSFAVVLPDERVVAASTTLSGSVIGAVQPGDVVDISSSGDGGASVTAAKVLCITTVADGCQGVLPASINPSTAGGGSSGGGGIGANQQANVSLILAVPAGDAASVAGSTVTLNLNTYCSFNEKGLFTNNRADFKCEVPGDRLASKGLAGLEDAQTSDTTEPPGEKTSPTTPNNSIKP